MHDKQSQEVRQRLNLLRQELKPYIKGDIETLSLEDLEIIAASISNIGGSFRKS